MIVPASLFTRTTIGIPSETDHGHAFGPLSPTRRIIGGLNARSFVSPLLAGQFVAAETARARARAHTGGVIARGEKRGQRMRKSIAPSARRGSPVRADLNANSLVAGVLPVLRLTSSRLLSPRSLDRPEVVRRNRSHTRERANALPMRARMRTQLNETGIASEASPSSSSFSSACLPLAAVLRVSENLIYTRTHSRCRLSPNRTCSAILSMIWMLIGDAQ